VHPVKRKSEAAGELAGRCLLPLPDPAAIAARTAELLADAEANPAVHIIDPDKASQYFRARAAADQSRANESAIIMRLRPSSWAGSGDEPQPGDRCSCCRGGRWWIERVVKRGWRCGICHPPPARFGMQWVRT